MVSTDLILRVAGFACILIMMVDVFQTIFNPHRTGSLSQRTLNLLWRRTFARADVHSRILTLAGPLFVICVILGWFTATILGWALIYQSYLPGEAFSLSPGVLPAEQSGILDALYLSAVVQTTLGLGDITPRSDFLRIMVPTQATTGFAILTAGVTWVLGLYPALIRRQQFTQMLRVLNRQLGEQGLMHPSIAEGEGPTIVREVAQQMMMIRSDLLQFPISFFFAGTGSESSLPEQLLYVPRLIASAPHAADDQPAISSVRFLELALEDLCETIDSRFPVVVEDQDTLEAYVKSAGFAREP